MITITLMLVVVAAIFDSKERCSRCLLFTTETTIYDVKYKIIRHDFIYNFIKKIHIV